MTPWELLIDESALGQVLPDEHRSFAKPVKEGLVVFLGGLPSIYQRNILEKQAALPPTATVSQRLGLLAAQCPVLQKLGQVLARDQRLAPELRRELCKLESLSPSTPIDAITQTLDDELGSLDRRGVKLVPPALAEASVAVVVPFEQHSPPRQGVFKVLKPGIEARLELELQLLSDVGAHLDEACHRLGIPELDYQDSFEQVREKLAWELRLDQEQKNLTDARRFYADDSRILIPEVLEHCSPRVTAMERVYGEKVTDHRLDGAAARRRLATLVSHALICRPILSRASRAMFHSDPHAGNLFLTKDGRLALLDWSLVGSLDDRQRSAMSQLTLAALTQRCDTIVSVLEGLSERGEVDRSSLEKVVSAHLKRIRAGQLPGLAWLAGLLDEASQSARLRVAPDLMLFRKSLLTLEGVIADLGAEGVNPDQVMTKDFLRHFAAEWPLRWLSPVLSRDFATRLSNFDLAEAMVGLPFAIARCAVDKGFDALERRLSSELSGT